MRKSLLVLTLATWCCQACDFRAIGQSATAHASNAPATVLIEQVGLLNLLNQIPAEIHQSAQRQATRCSSMVLEYSDASIAMIIAYRERLDQKLGQAETQELVEWYRSPIGSRIRNLEKAEIDAQALMAFSPDEDRSVHIERIYQNTGVGKLDAGIGVNLEYAGWLISGCKQVAEKSADKKKLAAEIQYSEMIKADTASFEIMFKKDTLHGMSYVFSKLSDDELIAYAEFTEKHSAVYGVLVDELLDSIESAYKLFVQQHSR